MGPQYIGAFLALTAALTWGGGDFIGGYGSRRLSHFPVLFLSTIGSLTILTGVALLMGERIPSWSNLMYAIPAGVIGALGMGSLFKGLSLGNPAIVAPIAGVIQALLPLLVGMMDQGIPGWTKLLGFGLGLVGIWLVTRVKSDQVQGSRVSIILAVAAGLGFGSFLVLITRMDTQEIYFPLVAAKFAALITVLIMIKLTGQTVPRINAMPIVLFSGMLDAFGNIFYLVANQFTRLDIVAVLSSFYPAITVLLSFLILKDKILRTQWIGVFVCVSAIILISF